MRLINFSLATLLISLPALAAQPDSILFQVSAHHEARPARTPSFWEILSGRARLEADLTVKVTDAATGAPIPGAAVMVGSRLGEPFADNTLRTADDGTAAFTHESLRSGGAFPITVGKAGYTLLTLFGRGENTVEVALQPIPGENDYGFLQGRLNGFPPGMGPGQIELGLFVPATRPEGLLNFDLGLFVSNYKVKIDVYGERDVPGNLVLPPQSKRYGVIPLNLNKPEYIMPLPKGLEAHMSGMTGTMPINPAVDAIRKKDYISVLNMSQFNHVGWTRRMKVTGDERFDLTANYEVVPGQLASRVTGVPAGADVASISLVDPAGDGGDFVAMDIKAVNAEDVKGGSAGFRLGLLRAQPTDSKYFIFTAFFDRHRITQPTLGPSGTPDFRWLVASTKQVSGTGRAGFDTRFADFLSAMRPQSVDAGNREYRFSPAASPTLAPELTMLNIVSEKQNRLTQGAVRTVLWSAIVPGTASAISLPDLGRPVLPAPDTSRGERLFWEVVAIKSRLTATPEFNLQSALRNVEHVSSFLKAY